MSDERIAALSGWNADWRGLKVVVLGAGVTGFAAADTLAELGCDVLVAAAAATPERRDLLEVIGVRLVTGDPAGQAAALAAFAPDLVVVSPGYHPDDPALQAAAGVPVIGDVELAWRLRDKAGAPAPWLTITGTNGKTTTTRLTAAMLEADGRRVAVVGNIGTPVLDAIRDPTGFDVFVVELSSYQLHWMEQVAPVASACLNVADDHLDWHGSFEAYATAKGRVYERTEVACVYNLADPTTERLVRQADVAEGCRAIGFTLGVPAVSDLGVVDGVLVDRAFLDTRRTAALELTTVAELAERGLSAPHLVADVLAAAALARAVGVPAAAIRQGLRTVHLDPHRIEPAGEIDGIHFVDDSKATNPHAAAASLGAFERVVWIAGGLTKGVDVAPLVQAAASRLAGVVLIGADRSAFLTALERHAPGVPVTEVTAGETGAVMAEAVRAALGLASPGDVVLLAPAAASMDQFTDYADRGRRFAEAVRAAR